MDARYWRLVFTIVATAAVATSFVLGAVLYPHLPATIPQHVGMDGTTSGSMPRMWIFLIPSISLAVLFIQIFFKDRGLEYRGMLESQRAAAWFSIAAACWLLVYTEWLIGSVGQHPGSAPAQWPMAVGAALILAGVAANVFLGLRRARECGNAEES